MKKILLISLLLLTTSQFVIAQKDSTVIKNPILTSKFQIGVGLFIPTQKVKFNVSATSENEEISFGESFDFNNQAGRPNMSFDWRFSKRWKLAAEYFNASYVKKATLKEDIEIGDSDYTFEEGSEVKIGYKIKLYRVYVGRVISSGLKHELGGGLGFHILNVGPFIKGEININGNNNEFKTAAVSATAPLPNIAFWYHFAPTPKWAFSTRLDWFGITVGDYSGSLWDISPSIHYQIIKNLAIAVDYRYFKVNANVNKEVWNGGFDLSFSGPTFTLLANF